MKSFTNKNSFTKLLNEWIFCLGVSAKIDENIVEELNGFLFLNLYIICKGEKEYLFWVERKIEIIA